MMNLVHYLFILSRSLNFHQNSSRVTASFTIFSKMKNHAFSWTLFIHPIIKISNPFSHQILVYTNEI